MTTMQLPTAEQAGPLSGGADLSLLRKTLQGALRGKEEVIEYVLAALLGRGHILLEDAPGLGKTTLAKALAAATGCRFARIQCTPDLLPGDITGFNLYNQHTRSMEFVPGPVFADIVLADEINRATPRTQSALLEVMAERQMTIDNVTHRLSERFFVIATQNPLELHGTFPLPESLMDRFAVKLRIGYPGREQVVELLGESIGRQTGDGPHVRQAIRPEDLSRWQQRTAETAASPAIRDYLARLGDAIRAHHGSRQDISPRGLLIWLRLSQAWAQLQGRDFVIPEDLQALAHPVLAVRLGVETGEFPAFLEEILAAVPVPDYRG
jgi:MoxR-like ATPase